VHLIIKLLLILLACVPATGWSADLHYILSVQVNTKNQNIIGTALLKGDVTKKIGLSVRNLNHLKVDGNPITPNADDSINLTVERTKGTLITYEARFPGEGTNFIDKDNVFLIEDWYPQPDVLVEYTLSVTLPKDFIATSEAEATTIQERGDTKTFNFQFKHPLDILHLAASTRYVLKKDVYKNIAIETYFFREDAQLADTYITHTREYLAMYEEMLTAYPYRRFAIVENIFPTGYSMPTYTLLGKRVVHLPFITKTSLGHEILHQWFGNSVYIDFAHGNWAEGITTYLADHHYAALEDKDIAYRKQIMVNFDAYVNSDNAMPVSDFLSRRNKAQSTIGYGKSAMLFHGLRKRYGDKTFFAALREFIQQNGFREASWHDIQRAFEKVTGEKLYSYFGHRLHRKDIPHLNVQDAELRAEQGKLKLKLTLLQKGEAYPLRIPITLYTGSGKGRRVVKVKASEERIDLTLDEPPINVVLDENYDLMRQLDTEEIPPVLAGIMGKQKLIAAISDGQRAVYQPIVDALGVKNITYASPEEVTPIQITENSFLIAGYDNTLVNMLFGKQAIPKDGVRLKVFYNPFKPTERILLLHVKNTAEVQAVRRKIPHYGKYSDLAFNEGKNTYKGIAETNNGIYVFTRPAPRVIAPDKLPTLYDILPELLDSRIIFVGEQHDKFAHHINQLQIIRKIHEAGHKIAVGMEMFQIPYQQTVDDYLAGQIDEYTFLLKSEYFNNWGYNYNLYKPIVDYLKQQNIPLITLNIDGRIARKVARNGIHSLTGEEKRRLPSEMDFSNERYRGDLDNVFTPHATRYDYRDFNYFLQAQTLRDESMAESAQRFLSNHSEFKLVILAGNGHISHKYGIPERLHRRNHEPFTVVVQDEEATYGIADYILLTTELKGIKSPRLGVTVEERDGALVVTGVTNNSPAEAVGLQKGDIIKQFAEKPIKSAADLKLALYYSEMGSTANVQLKRDDQTLHKEIELFGFERYSTFFPAQKHKGRQGKHN